MYTDINTKKRKEEFRTCNDKEIHTHNLYETRKKITPYTHA